MTGSPEARPRWAGVLTTFALSSVAALVAGAAFLWSVDPYGARTGPDRAPGPIMDLNGRYMYPQVVRSGRYDGAVFGTSTIRLLDPRRLSEAFHTRVANLGLNAGTPWEQTQLATLFLRHVPSPSLVMFGLDRNWCDADAASEAKRLTFRSFPPWLYDENRLHDLRGEFNLKSLEIALRVILHAANRMPERIRADGYEVFTPPEARYDLARAQAQIWSRDVPAPARSGPVGSAPQDTLSFPALAWLGTLLAKVPTSSRVVLVLPPVHVAAQAEPGSSDAARDSACKAEIARLAKRAGATLIDFRLASPLTSEDAHYWDRLHVRLPVAGQVLDDIVAASRTGQDAADGRYRVLSVGRRD